MTEIAVERKNRVPWWVGLIALLLIVAMGWFWFGRGDPYRVLQTPSPEAAAAPTSSVVNTPAQSPTAKLNPAAGTGAAMTSAAPNAFVTDPGFYAATAEKGSLAGREAGLTRAKVVRIVGPKTFTVASGNEELFVVIDPDLSIGVGSQGEIGVGDTVTLKGTFQRLDQDTIRDLANRRFRALMELERETLSKTQIYLHATQFDRRN